jgi:outer membrane protein assembly factor BamB
VGGILYCLDAVTGAAVWKHDTFSSIWGSLLLAGDRLYVGNEDGTMTVLRAGRHKEVLAEFGMDGALYTRPARVGDTLYLATSKRLYFIAAKP